MDEDTLQTKGPAALAGALQEATRASQGRCDAASASRTEEPELLARTSSRTQRRILFQSPVRSSATGGEGAMVLASSAGGRLQDEIRHPQSRGLVFAGLVSGSSAVDGAFQEDQKLGRTALDKALESQQPSAGFRGDAVGQSGGQTLVNDGDDDSLSLLSPNLDTDDRLVLASCTPTSPVRGSSPLLYRLHHHACIHALPLSFLGHSFSGRKIDPRLALYACAKCCSVLLDLCVRTASPRTCLTMHRTGVSRARTDETAYLYSCWHSYSTVSAD